MFRLRELPPFIALFQELKQLHLTDNVLEVGVVFSILPWQFHFACLTVCTNELGGVVDKNSIVCIVFLGATRSIARQMKLDIWLYVETGTLWEYSTESHLVRFHCFFSQSQALNILKLRTYY